MITDYVPVSGGSIMATRPSNRYYKKKRKKKRDTTIKPVKPAFIILPVIAAAILAAVLIIVLRPEDKTARTRYLASSSRGVPYYYFNEDENRLIRSSQSIPRGTQVLDLDRQYTENGIDYAVIELNGNLYYINQSSLVEDPHDIIQETQVWVRTSCTVYENETGCEIASAAKKGDCLEVLDYDSMNKDGSINKYKISFTDVTGADVTGWVYGKYLVPDEEEALAVNNEIYEIHKNRVYSAMELYGGLPTTLDWYPVEKPAFPDNTLLEKASAMYLTIDSIQKIDDYIELAKNSGVNAMVIDIKDNLVAYPCDEIKDICPNAYKTAFYGSASQYKEAVKKCQDAGLYCIGRIVAFKDSVFAGDHPESCIISSVSSQTWPSAYSRECWYYNIRLAIAAARLCGFNEIQFDYVRFPEAAYNMSISGDTDFRNTYDEEKAEAIQNFCYYACDALHEEGVYVSIDVFGECANAYVTAYGQYYPAISLVVDAISGMPYPDHYGREEDTWSNPYPIMNDWGFKADLRSSETPNPAVNRVWVAAYDVPFWDPYVICDSGYIASQVQGLVDAGLTGGFITWNAESNFSKYQLIADAWSRSYDPS